MATEYPNNPYIQLRGVDESNGDTNLMFHYFDNNNWRSTGWIGGKKGKSCKLSIKFKLIYIISYKKN